MDRFCQCHSVTTVQDAATRLYRCVVEITMKAECEHKCGPSKGATVSQFQSQPSIQPLLQLTAATNMTHRTVYTY